MHDSIDSGLVMIEYPITNVDLTYGLDSAVGQQYQAVGSETDTSTATTATTGSARATTTTNISIDYVARIGRYVSASYG
jgi:hypothetical protein